MTTALQKNETPDAPPPFGHYVQGMISNGTIHVSGQLAANPDGTHGFDAPFEAQARRSLLNAVAIIRQGGGDIVTTIIVTAYVVGVENWPVFNAIFLDIFGDFRPARAVVPVPKLHHGYLIEVMATAAVR